MSGAVAVSAPARRGVGIWMLLAASVCAFGILVGIFWVGFLGSDDSLYWRGSDGWLIHIPYLGDDHWSLRHTLVIPMALARETLGDGLPALLLPSLLYAIGGLIVAALWVYRAAGMLAAAVAMALIVTNPQLILLASVANIDLVEVFFVLSAFALIHAAMPRASRRPGLLLLAGVSLGLGMVSRETSAFAVLALGLLFLAGYGMRRAEYCFIGVGWAAVVGLEAAYVWWMSGDPFYRSSISLHHDASIDRWVDQGASVPILHPAIDPLTMLLFNHNFGLLTWIGVPLVIWLARRGGLTGSARRLAALASVLAAVWTVVAAALWGQLDLIPRYFLLPALLISMLSGMALAALWTRGRRRLAIGLGGALIVANLASIWIDSRNTMMFGEHALLDLAARETSPIHTDPQTLRRCALLLQWSGLAARVTDSPAGPGDLFFLDPTRTEVKPGAGWTLVDRQGPRPAIRMWLAAHLVPPKLLSPGQFTKLSQGHPDVTLWRLP